MKLHRVLIVGALALGSIALVGCSKDQPDESAPQEPAATAPAPTPEPEAARKGPPRDERRAERRRGRGKRPGMPGMRRPGDQQQRPRQPPPWQQERQQPPEDQGAPM